MFDVGMLVEEVMLMFDDFVCVGKLCYIGVLNFVGW